MSALTNSGPNESLFQPLFNTNYSASDVLEIEEIRTIIHAHEQELALVDDEITRQESILNELKCRRDLLSRSINNHRILLSPIRRLFPELLAEIFIHCLPSNHLPTRSSAEAPLLLLRICKRWRDIALKTPRLWCGIHIHVPNHPLSNPIMTRRVEGIKQWLERSGSELPISISIYCPRRLRHFVNLSEEAITGRNMPPGIATFVHDLADTYSRRWKSLEVMLPLDAMSIITSLRTRDIPILQHLSVAHSSFHSFDTNTLFNFIARIPSLHTLRLNHDFVLEKLPDFVKSLSSTNTLSSLTELSLKPTLPACMPTNKALDILTQTPNLRSCTMHLLVPSSMLLLETRSYHVVLPHLHTLDLFLGHDFHEAMSGSLLLPIFRQLSLPSLESLYLHAPNIIVKETYIPFLDFLTDRMKHLLLEIQMTAKAWIECLRRVPNLVSLEGKCCESDYVPMKVHTNKWEGVLRLLGLWGETVVGDGCCEIETALGGRGDGDGDGQGKAKLNSIAAQFIAYEKLTEEDWDLISQLREGGTDVYLRLPPNPQPIDSPWYRIPKTSLLDGREIMWDWQDEHSLDYEGWTCVYSTGKELVTRVGT
ncbi:hypothetical protein D9758_011508 [Tetrapyrgos nigripes]|uniref:F-box domain-containing protein n=1 Tax=Tetrapyrgos nigripes TaxID=182062 RepID=A0A8H5CQV0_9AGAR|nr:hypothetical protein D9758_011508 [Tetrapyrgos nigripes]